MDVIVKTFVIDASVVLAWLLPDEMYKPPANRILTSFGQKTIDLVAPTILLYEILNGITASLLRKRIDTLFSEKLLFSYQSLEILLKEPDEKHILEVSAETSLSSHDSAYISLALQKNKPLITADKKLYNTIKKNIGKNVIWIEDFYQEKHI